MTSQFEKRKAKEEQALVELAEKRKTSKKSTKKAESVLTNMAFDVILNSKGRHELVILKYNPETKKAEVVEIKPVTRDVGIIFNQKKTALKTLAHIKE